MNAKLLIGCAVWVLASFTACAIGPKQEDELNTIDERPGDEGGVHQPVPGSDASASTSSEASTGGGGGDAARADGYDPATSGDVAATDTSLADVSGPDGGPKYDASPDAVTDSAAHEAGFDGDTDAGPDAADGPRPDVLRLD